jgi:hypothetical protein
MMGFRGAVAILVGVATASLLGAVGFAPLELARDGSARATWLAGLLTVSTHVLALVAQTAAIAFVVYEPAEARDRLSAWLGAAGVIWLPVALWLVWLGSRGDGSLLWTLRFLTAAGLPSIAALLGAAALRRRA